MSKELPKLVLNRNYVMTTLKGHSVEFKKGVATMVPPAVYQEAISIGAVPEDGSDPDVLQDERTAVTPSDPEERSKKLLEAFETLIARNERGDFTAAGTPTIGAVTAEVGFKVQAKEIATAWQKRNELQAEQ